MSFNPNARPELAIGIDSGTHTGFAVWNRTHKRYDEICTLKIHQALFRVREMHQNGHKIVVVVEDARKAVHGRKGAVDVHKAQGAGSIKRDAKIWEDFLKEYKIPYTMKRPTKALTKWTKEQFRIRTGYTGQTGEHNRDAALLVYQY